VIGNVRGLVDGRLVCDGILDYEIMYLGHWLPPTSLLCVTTQMTTV
jgi:hypothetical protein